jgi:hypothetical protein
MLTRLFARISVRLDRVFDGDGDMAQSAPTLLWKVR